MFLTKINRTCHIRNSKINYSNSNKNIFNNIGRLTNFDQNSNPFIIIEIKCITYNISVTRIEHLRLFNKLVNCTPFLTTNQY